MLTDIYGTEAAAGVSKLLTAPRGGISKTLELAAGAEGAKLEQEEERTSRITLERRDARAKAAATEEDLDVTIKEQYEEDVREIGEAKRKVLRRREPVRQWFRELFTIGEEKEKEEAAYRKWLERLTPEERRAIEKKYLFPSFPRLTPYAEAWEQMPPQQKYEELVQTPTIINYEIHNHHDTIYNPVVGEKVKGPRFTQD